MRMELIQPFINAADAVFAEALQAPTKIIDLTMEEEAYRRKGIAALVTIRGDIEGRIILDLAPEVALKVAGCLSGAPVLESEEIVRETVCELANMVIGNSVTLLNDKGFRFKTSPPEIHTRPEGLSSSHDTEAMVVAFETPCGDVYLNIAMHYLRRRQRDRDAMPVVD
ncbi:MAG: chemotaxis protein CheX [Candidatus Acidiferrales bacterium]